MSPELSTTDYAILASLTICPMSGYELRGFIQSSIGNFWSESYGQLYPALKRLESGKLLRSADKPTGKRPKRVYSITAAGRKTVGAWLSRPAAEQVRRVELLLKIFFAQQVPLLDLAAHISRHQQAAESRLAHYRAIATSLQQQHSTNPALKYWLSTARFGELHALADLEWCREMLAQFIPSTKPKKSLNRNKE